ncbi:hypothetical protein EROM_110080 [Encephalitozoon romaleae SJ-2008]|uniref:Ubiquitin-like domain-containing protein n=1 Tax=Encephalitozoon romaleae (strain SJ-2008) TaxID=1178016 RepID=I7AU34_ENCRO|nr:hypothetical protein EROM_110080 [Encephalitozoon romaleae SJ-2008]AFN83992.1 hypothetical protein EROM_110080 [Encephalitozoon romaleae SJ-2008]
MIVRAINYEDLYIDSDFKDIGDLKTKIALKYGIPTDSQCIVFNGKFYVLGIFDSPLETFSDTYGNPLGPFGCPDAVFNYLESNGMSIDKIRAHVFPHKEDPKEKSPTLSRIIGVKPAVKKVIEGRYEDISKISEGLKEEEKAAVIENPGEYIDLILTQVGESL